MKKSAGLVRCADCKRIIKGYNSRVDYKGTPDDWQIYPYKHQGSDGADCEGRFKVAEKA